MLLQFGNLSKYDLVSHDHGLLTTAHTSFPRSINNIWLMCYVVVCTLSNRS